MNMTECMAFYVQAAKIDTRLPPRKLEEFDAWEMVLADIPPNFAPMIFRKIYRVPQIIPLQSGDIVKAWDAVREEVNAAIARCRTFARRMADLDIADREDAVKYNEIVDAHNAAVDSLPVEVAAANGFERKELVPVPGERVPAPAPAWFKSL
nr:MAG TPA: hypothetical protein [Caudoviricetes sp.]